MEEDEADERGSRAPARYVDSSKNLQAGPGFWVKCTNEHTVCYNYRGTLFRYALVS